MNRRRLGNSGLELTTIGIGTWAIGGGNWLFGWGAQEEEQSLAAMRRAIELGINWVDTAPIYGIGHAERVVGKFLKEYKESERPLVATKFGRFEKQDKTIGGCLKRDAVFAECESSLKNLGVDCINLYQMHWPDPDDDIEEGWRACVDLIKQGKVRQIGVSNQNVSQMKRLTPIHPIASLQPPFSLIQRGIEDETLAYCASNNIGVVCYSPMGKGLLTGAFDVQRAADLPDIDHRSRGPEFQPPQLEINLQFVESLRAVADQHGRPVAQLAIAWCLRRPEVTAAIVGMRRPEQIETVVAASDWNLNEADIQAIDAAISRRDEQLVALTP